MPSVRVTGGAQLHEVARKLRAKGSEGKQIRTGMRKAITAAVEPMKTDVQQAIREIPSKGHDGPSLREQMVKATRVRIVASGRTALVRLEVAGSRMPDGRENLPAFMDGERDRWMHPVYDSSRERWTKTAQPAHPFFARTVRPRLPEVRRAVQAAVKTTLADL